MDREVEYVEENEKERRRTCCPEALMWILIATEAHQFSEANEEPRAAKRTRESDIPVDYLRMLASFTGALSRTLIR
jgi:hypothetical protein